MSQTLWSRVAKPHVAKSHVAKSHVAKPHVAKLNIKTKFATASLALLTVAGTSAAFAASPTSPEGIWYTKGEESIIKVTPCKAAFCGSIIWLKEPNEADGSPKIDKLNTDPAKKNQPIVGTDILINMIAIDDHWKGKAYNPDDGKFYDITFKVKTEKEPNDQADLRGCILGFLCQTETFNRAADVPGGDPTLTAQIPGAPKKHGAPKKDTAKK